MQFAPYCIKGGAIREHTIVISLFSFMQDGEIWTFSVRAFDSPRPERTINVNYDGFAEGHYLSIIFWLKYATFFTKTNECLCLL